MQIVPCALFPWWWVPWWWPNLSQRVVSLLGFAAGAAALVLGVVQGFPVAEGVRMRRRIRRCRHLVDAAIERGERCIGSTKIPICRLSCLTHSEGLSAHRAAIAHRHRRRRSPAGGHGVVCQGGRRHYHGEGAPMSAFLLLQRNRQHDAIRLTMPLNICSVRIV